MAQTCSGTITVIPATTEANIQATAFSVTPLTGSTPLTVTVSGTWKNNGGTTGSITPGFTIVGISDYNETASVSLDPGQSVNLTSSTVRNQMLNARVAPYIFTIKNNTLTIPLPSVSVTVSEREATIVGSCTVDATVVTNNTFSVTANVAPGSVDANYKLVLTGTVTSAQQESAPFQITGGAASPTVPYQTTFTASGTVGTKDYTLTLAKV
jgi:hypothetical protein